jgi:hypothetical protein
MVPVLKINYDIFCNIHNAIKNGVTNDTNDEIKKIHDIITQKCSPQTTTFNFECCSGLSHNNFPNEPETFEAIGYFLRNSYIIQVADFSLKCLINAWKKFESNQNFMALFGGLCPLKQIGTCNRSIELKFNPKILSECKVAPLRGVGTLSESDFLVLHAMGSTIAFTTINQNDAIYTTQILTVAEKYDNKKPNIDCFELQNAIGTDFVGSVGHATIQYPEGGILICSMGHFCELDRIHTSQDRMMALASQLPLEMSEDFMTRIRTEPLDQMRIASQMVNCLSSDV